jgi:hypothetical protein
MSSSTSAASASSVLKTAGKRWFFKSVAWDRRVAKLYVQDQLPQKEHLHYVLPRIEGVIAPSTENYFYEHVPRMKQIHTIQTWRHTHNHLRDHLRNVQVQRNWVLLVSDNMTGKKRKLNTPRALRWIDKCTKRCTMWATADPNDPKSIDSVKEKIDAGAMGIITQPFLTSRAMDVFAQYPRDAEVQYVAGLAMPATIKGLMFWSHLLFGKCAGDKLFEEHVRYFQKHATATTRPPPGTPTPGDIWVEKQLQMLEPIESSKLVGIHMMPLANTKGLCTLLRKII